MSEEKVKDIAGGIRKDYWKKVHLIKKYLMEDKKMEPCNASTLARQLVNEAEGARLKSDEEYMNHARQEYDSKVEREDDFWEALGIKEPEEFAYFAEHKADERV